LPPVCERVALVAIRWAVHTDHLRLALAALWASKHTQVIAYLVLILPAFTAPAWLIVPGVLIGATARLLSPSKILEQPRLNPDLCFATADFRAFRLLRWGRWFWGFLYFGLSSVVIMCVLSIFLVMLIQSGAYR
jgi:hypothetical protein